MQEYRFKAKVENPDSWECWLHLGALAQPYPISFSYLKVPVKSRIEFVEGGERGFDVRKIHYLDFENALQTNGNSYREDYLARPKQKMLLSELEKEIIPHIPEALDGNLESIRKLKNFKIKSNNGFDLCGVARTSRYGAPKRAGKVVKPENNKKLSG